MEESVSAMTGGGAQTRTSLAVLAAVVVTFLVGCDGNGTSSVATAPVESTSLSSSTSLPSRAAPTSSEGVPPLATTTIPAALPPILEALDRRCGPLPSLSYRLGGSDGNLAGNSTPAQISVSVGTRFVLWAQFAQRHLGDFARIPATIREECNVNLAGPSGGPAAVFVAPSSSTWRITTNTNDCGPCANLTFEADVTGRG